MTRYISRSFPFALSLLLVACGGSGGGGSDNDGSGSGGPDDNGSGSINSSSGFDADGKLLHKTISSVSELSGDAGRQGFLFYSVADKDSTAPNRYTLKGINPELPPITGEPIVEQVQKMDYNSIDTVYAFPAASVSQGEISDYYIDRILLMEKTGSSSFNTKVVEATDNWPLTAKSLVFPGSQGIPGFAINYAFQHHLTQPESSTFNYVQTGTGFERHVTTINPDNNSTFYLDNELTPVVSLVTPDAHSPDGWIMGDFSGTDIELYEYDSNGNLRGVLESGDDRINNVVPSVETGSIPGTVFSDGSQLLTIHQIDSSTDPLEAAVTVYRYIPDDGNGVGTLEPLENSAGDHLELQTNPDLMIGNIAIFDDATYLFDGSGSHYELYRLEKDQWSEVTGLPHSYQSNTVVKAGDFMVWQGSEESLSYQSIYSLNSTDNKVVKLDSVMKDAPDEPDVQPKAERVGQPFFGNTDGMVYYNRERSIQIKVDEMDVGNTTIPIHETRKWVEAVARKASGTGNPDVITHAFWTAASTNGNGKLRGHMSLFDVGSSPRGITNSMEISELFMVTKHYIDDSVDSNGDDRYVSENMLVAVNANDPMERMVELGVLPDDYDISSGSYRETSEAAANVGEVGVGPHRLLGFDREYDSSSECALVYVNTRKANSLTDLEPDNAGECEAVRGY